MTEQPKFMYWLVVGESERIQFSDLPHMMANTLHPDASDIAMELYVIGLGEELKQAVSEGVLMVRNPNTMGRHTLPIGNALQRSVFIPYLDLEPYLNARGIGLRLTPHGSGPVYWTIENAFAALQEQENWHDGTRNTLQNQFMEAASRGEVVTIDPVTEADRLRKLVRIWWDWITPAKINNWLASINAPYRWTVMPPEPQAKRQPESANTPEISKSAKPDGRLLIQAEAYALWLRLKASGANPSVHSICEPMAKWCADTGTTTHTGVTPRAGTIRNTILGGSSGWQPPKHNREQAKKELAQLAQVAQSKSA